MQNTKDSGRLTKRKDKEKFNTLMAQSMKGSSIMTCMTDRGNSIGNKGISIEGNGSRGEWTEKDTLNTMMDIQ